MTTVTDVHSGKPDAKECSTRDLLEQIQDALNKAKLKQDIIDKEVTALETHHQKVQEYDSRITAAVDAYKQGIAAVRAGFDDLRKAVEQAKGSYECLVHDDVKEEICKVLADLRKRRKSLETCAWNLQQQVTDKKCELDHANAEVDRANKKLDDMLALLAARTTELAALRSLKERISGCSDTSSNECRYAFYLDLKERLKAECVSVEHYRCDLVDLVNEVDAASQKARGVDEDARVVQDLLARVKKLHDDLVAGWTDQLCAAVTEGAIPALPPDIASACTPDDTPAAASGPMTGASEAPGEHEVEAAKPTADQAGCAATRHTQDECPSDEPAPPPPPPSATAE
jgi:predicted  nucleic acid-binding Zn-ribbon protein